MGAYSQADSAYTKYEFFKRLSDKQRTTEQCMKFINDTHFNIPSSLNLSDREFRDIVLRGLELFIKDIDRIADEK